MIELLFLLLLCLSISFLLPVSPRKYYQNQLGFISAIGLALFAVGTALTVKEQKKAAKRQRQAQAEATKRQQQADARERSRQVRQARVARAQAAQSIENQGAGGSSVAAGALGSIQTQLGANLAFQSNQQASVLRQTELLASASRAQESALTGQAISGLGTTLIGASDKFGKASGGQ